MRSTLGMAMAGVALTAAALGAAPVQAQDAPRVSTAPLTLDLPSRVTGYTYGSGSEMQTYLDLSTTLRATAGAFEVRAKRTSYYRAVKVTWQSPGGAVELPAWTMAKWGGLNNFLKFTITDSKGKVVAKDWTTTCLNGLAQRTRPEAPA